jgi:hypothetical protein
MGGEGSEKDLPDHLLCLLVHLRDQVHFTLVPDGVLPAESFAQHLARFLRRRECRLEFACHVFVLPDKSKSCLWFIVMPQPDMRSSGIPQNLAKHRPHRPRPISSRRKTC